MPSVRTWGSGSARNWIEQSNCAPSHLWGLKTMLSAFSTPSHNPRNSGQIIADPAHAASTWTYRSYARATSVAGPTLSDAPIDVPPTHNTTPAGRNPAARSSSIAARSASGSSAPEPSVGTLTRFRWPIPAIRTALSMDECVSGEA